MKTFIVQYRIDGDYDAKIKAESLEEAVRIALSMSKEALNKAPGDVLEETVEILGVYQ